MPRKPKRQDDELRTDVIADLTSPAARHTTTEAKRSRASYDLDPETIKAIKQLAKELEVPIWLVAQRLLSYALEAHEQGELKLRRTPIVTTRWGLEQ